MCVGTPDEVSRAVQGLRRRRRRPAHVRHALDARCRSRSRSRRSRPSASTSSPSSTRTPSTAPRASARPHVAKHGRTKRTPPTGWKCPSNRRHCGPEGQSRWVGATDGSRSSPAPAAASAPPSPSGWPRRVRPSAVTARTLDPQPDSTGTLQETVAAIEAARRPRCRGRGRPHRRRRPRPHRARGRSRARARRHPRQQRGRRLLPADGRDVAEAPPPAVRAQRARAGRPGPGGRSRACASAARAGSSTSRARRRSDRQGPAVRGRRQARVHQHVVRLHEVGARADHRRASRPSWPTTASR